MSTYSVTVYDELGASLFSHLTILAKTVEDVINIIESDPKHEYEIIEIEKVA